MGKRFGCGSMDGAAAYHRVLDSSGGTYSEIVWLLMGRITPTRANVRRLTGLPNTYLGRGPAGGYRDVRAPHLAVVQPPQARDDRRVMLLVVLVRGVGVAQPADGSWGQVGKDEGIGAVDPQAAADERGEPGHVLVPDRVALGLELADGGVQVDGRPQNEAIQDKAEGAELVLSEMILKTGYCTAPEPSHC
jgi:hypothetical protein